MSIALGVLGFVASWGLLLGLATLVKPFWFVKSRKQAGQLAGASLAVLVLAAGLSSVFPVTPPSESRLAQTAPQMPERPATVTEEEWQARSAACAEARLPVATCVGDDAKVARAREIIAERAQAAAEEAARAELEAEASRLADSRNREIVWIERTKDAVRARLRNPSSAEFRKVELFRPYAGRDTPFVCGEVNSENGFGGRSGFQRFIGSGNSAPVFLEEEVARGEFGPVYAEMCRNAPPPAAQTK
jgi:hypothetical protein